MKATGKTMQLEYRNSLVQVEVFTSGRTELFRINLQTPLFITKTKTSDQHTFWTSVPEGRLDEAIEIGKLIDEKKNLPEQKSLF